MTKSALLAVALGTLMVAGTANSAEADPRVAPTKQRFNQPLIGDSHRHNFRPRIIMRDRRFPIIRKETRRMERNMRIDEILFRHDSPPPPPPP